jgi:hypothetical protein
MKENTMKRKYFNLGKDMRVSVDKGIIEYKLYPSQSSWNKVSGNIKGTKVYKFIADSYGDKDGAKKRLMARKFLLKNMNWSFGK